jgi:hypothetical protein
MREDKLLTAASSHTASRWFLPAIIALYIVISAIYIWQVPHFEGPDERQHFAYIEWLAEGKGFPPQGDAAFKTLVEQEAGQSPLYYLLASIPARLIGITAPPIIYRENPHAFSGSGLGGLPDNENVAIHYPDDGQPLAGGWLALYVARIISLLFGILLIVCVYGLAQEVFPKIPAIAWSAALLAAVTPQVVFIGSVTSNDVPAAATSALTLWLLAMLVRRGPSTWRTIGVGIAFGLALLTKTSAVALALPIGAGVAWLWLSGRYPLKTVLKTAVFLAVACLLVAGWWFLRSWILFDAPLGLSTHDQTPWAIGGPIGKLHTPFARWQDVFRSYWIAFGWGTIRPNIWIYRIITVISAASLAGMVLAVWRWRRRTNHSISISIVLIVLLFFSVLGVGISLEIWMRRVVASYGRLMFPALSAIVILLVIGWYALHPKLPLVIGGLFAVLTLTAPFWLIRPAFSLPEFLEPDEIAELSPSIGWLYGTTIDNPVAELMSATPLEQSMGAGGILPVEICWRIIAQSKRPFSVLVHIIGPENRLVTNRRTYPGLGSYPTNIWQPDDVFCDVVQIFIWSNLAETLVYEIEIAMIDLEEGKRLLAFDAGGNPIEATFASKILLIASGSQEDYPSTEAGGEAIQLVDYSRPENWFAGKQHDVTLRWGVAEKVDQDYQVFVHLRDGVSNSNVAQADGPPVGGWYPTSYWGVGEVIEDKHSFHLPNDIDPGTYNLVVGFYDLLTGERQGSEQDLGSVIVQP